MSDVGRTFVMVKPDGVRRGLIGDVISRLEERGLKLVAGKFVQLDEELAREHYSEHEGESYFEALVDFITSGPVFAMVWEGRDAARRVRETMGATNPAEADPSTIRGEYGQGYRRNVVHGSDPASEDEIRRFFEEEELVEYERLGGKWLSE